MRTEEIQEIEATQENLYYKEAYTFLFSSLSDIMGQQMEIVKELIKLHRQAEAICTTGLPNAKVPPELILQLFAEMIKRDLQE